MFVHRDPVAIPSRLVSRSARAQCFFLLLFSFLFSLVFLFFSAFHQSAHLLMFLIGSVRPSKCLPTLLLLSSNVIRRMPSEILYMICSPSIEFHWQTLVFVPQFFFFFLFFIGYSVKCDDAKLNRNFLCCVFPCTCRRHVCRENDKWIDKYMFVRWKQIWLEIKFWTKRNKCFYVLRKASYYFLQEKRKKKIHKRDVIENEDPLTFV